LIILSSPVLNLELLLKVNVILLIPEVKVRVCLLSKVIKLIELVELLIIFLKSSAILLAPNVWYISKEVSLAVVSLTIVYSLKLKDVIVCVILLSGISLNLIVWYFSLFPLDGITSGIWAGG